MGPPGSWGVGPAEGGQPEAVCEVNRFSAASQGAAPTSSWGGERLATVDLAGLPGPTKSEMQR